MLFAMGLCMFFLYACSGTSDLEMMMVPRDEGGTGGS